jgi:hypothetical protein
MALPHYTKIFGIAELRIAKLLTDPAGAPPATYGASVPLVGSMKLTPAATINTKPLRGDSRLLDADSVYGEMTATLDWAKASLDALAVMFSTVVVDSGSTPNQLATWSHASTDTLNYFKLEGRALSADPIAGDILVSFWKCKLSAFAPPGLAEEDYWKPTSAIIILPRLADNLDYQVVIRETKAVLT